jgi:folate-binding protein YgfZ
MNHLFKLLRFTGADAADFLQGQLTQDLRKLGAASALPAAWCDPKGRVICLMRLLDPGDGLGLVVPAELADALRGRFMHYRLRARVEIGIGEDWRAAAIAGRDDVAALEDRGLLPPSERLASRRAQGLIAIELGGPERTVELHGSEAAFAAAGLEPERSLSTVEWRRAMIEAGIPHVGGESSEKYTPHMLNLDLLGAVSFDKGCYIGQEVVARTEHRGRSRRRLAHYRLAEGEAASGDRLMDGDRDAGQVVDAAAGHLLAVVPLELHDRTLTLNGRSASPLPLPYAMPS